MEPRESTWAGRVGDYLQLTRPRIGVMTVVAVAASAFVARWGQPDWGRIVAASLGVLLVAASASAMNQWLERDTDRQMPRTARRPLVDGRLSGRQVLWFVGVLVVAGLATLALGASLSAMFWAAATWLIYVLLYTPLKRRSSLNTAVGAVSGAMPIVIGWAAVDGVYDLRLAALFTTLYLWQFPHFMAIAWLYRAQYERAGLRMLTVVEATGRRAGLQAVTTALILIPVSCIPAIYGPAAGASLYVAWAFVLGVAQFACAVMFFAQRSEATARVLLAASLVYLPTLLGLLVLVPLA
jgi:protoheme IX farnesyltransferase